MYIDIDVHHGDGVEEAFLTTDRVLTLSFHQFGDVFFPGTGKIQDTGAKDGRYHSLNVPLKEGIDDDKYIRLFDNIVKKAIEVFNPDTIVMQCGADSLGDDKLGSFNLTVHGHARAVQTVLGMGRPVILLGGGGYSITNVARCWAFETAVAVGETIPDEIPKECLYYKKFANDPHLNFKIKNINEDLNDEAFLRFIEVQTLENIKNMEAAPNTAFNTEVLFHSFLFILILGAFISSFPCII